jgi:menaquinone-dependent protoporphyrinogen IX oxidase
MKSEQSRRKFIVNSSKIIATIIGLVTFGKYFSNAQTKTSTIVKKPIIKDGNNNNILVVYDSQFGSTAKIAEFIGKNLSISDQKVDVKKINEVNDLSIYNHIIIGSAIQYDKWMTEAKDFIIKNKIELSTKSVSFFLVCLFLSKKTDKATIKANNYANEIENLVPQVKVNNFGKFAGVLDYSKMSFVQRILAKGIFAIVGVKEGDYRDWNSIKKWSENIEI